MFQGAAKAVEFGDDELVAGSVGRVQGLVKVGPAGELAAGLVEEDFVAAGRQEGVVLGFGVLVAGGDPRGSGPGIEPMTPGSPTMKPPPSPPPWRYCGPCDAFDDDA